MPPSDAALVFKTALQLAFCIPEQICFNKGLPLSISYHSSSTDAVKPINFTNKYNVGKRVMEPFKYGMNKEVKIPSGIKL